MTYRLPCLIVLGVLLPMLAACSGGHDNATAGQPPYTALARFLQGDEVTVIQVTVSDRRPLRAAELVGPAGAVIAAESVEASPAAGDRQTFLRQPLGGGFGRDGLGVALPFAGYGNFGSQTPSLGPIQSAARIRLTDPASYAKDWRLWQVRLRIGDPPNATVVNLPAPQPPPSL